jgi:cell division protein FtsB
MLRWLEVVAAVALTAFVFGYIEGRASFKDAVIVAQKKQMQAAELASIKESERLAAETKQASLAQQLEDAANAQSSTTHCLPVARVLRLNQR